MERPNSLMDYVKLDTYLMRSSSDAEYIYLREVLLEQGVDLGRAVVACYYDNGGAFYGVVVTPDRKVVEFDLFYMQDGERSLAGKPPQWTGAIRWQNITDAHDTAADEYVTCALQLIDSDYTNT